MQSLHAKFARLDSIRIKVASKVVVDSVLQVHTWIKSKVLPAKNALQVGSKTAVAKGVVKNVVRQICTLRWLVWTRACNA